MSEVIARIRRRRGTAAAWTTADPVLKSGEYGLETDTFKLKLGDDVSTWTQLEYLPYSTITQLLITSWNNKQDALPVADETTFGKVMRASNAEGLAGVETTKFVSAFVMKNAIESAIAALINSSPDALNTLNELAVALGNDPNFATTISNALGNRVLYTDILDVLNSTAVNKTLSANQGKVLKDLIDTINTNLSNYILISNILDVLTSSATDKPLSANQGRILKGLIDTINTNLSNYVLVSDIINVLTSTLTNKPLSANMGKTLKDLIDALTASLSSEASTRSAADTALQNAIDSLTADLAQEISDRATSEADIYTAIDVSENNAKSYADSLVEGLFDDRGDYDPTVTNLFPASGGSGPGGAIKKGDIWRISVDGNINGDAFDINDWVRALVDDADPSDSSKWGYSEHNIDQATESSRGSAKLISTSDAEDENTTNDTDIVTGYKLWRAIRRMLDVAWTWVGKQSFTVAPRFSSVTANEYLKVDSNKDLTSVSAIPATDITEDTTHRFATDSEKTTWNAKQNALGFTPENSANKDASGGYVGLSTWKIKFRNAANTFTSFFENAATAARTYTFPDKDLTVIGTQDIVNDLTTGGTSKALSAEQGKTLQNTTEKTANKDATGGYAGLTLFKINFKNVANTFTSFFTNSNTAARTYTFQDSDDTIVGRSTTDTLTNKRITKRTGTTTSSATPTINTDNVDFYSITALSAAITSFTTNLSGTPTEGQTLWIAITDNGTARAIAWGASFEASTVSLPTTTVISTRLDVGFVWNTVTSKWRCIASA